MPIIYNNPIMQKVRGMLGGVVVYRQVNGRTIMSARPRKPTKESVIQKDNRTQFAAASNHARESMLSPELKEEYRLQAISMDLPNAYTAALTLKLRELKAASLQSDISDEPAAVVHTGTLYDSKHDAQHNHEQFAQAQIKLIPNSIEESLENCMRQLQDAIIKVDHLLTQRTQLNYDQVQAPCIRRDIIGNPQFKSTDSRLPRRREVQTPDSMITRECAYGLEPYG